MQLKFKIEPNYFIAHTLSSMANDRFSSTKYRKDIVNFQNFAWEASNNCYDILAGRMYPEKFVDEKVIGAIKKVPQYLLEIKQSESYKKILEQTREYLEFCQKQWEENYERTNAIIEKFTCLTFKKNFTVYITHPSLKNGCYLGDNKIAWGHNEDWPNYATVYLWHEILHSYLSNSELDHALVSFITDEELRIQLNKSKYPPFVSHKELLPLMKKVLPYWQEFLTLKEKNILELKKKLTEVLKINPIVNLTS